MVTKEAVKQPGISVRKPKVKNSVRSERDLRKTLAVMLFPKSTGGCLARFYCHMSLWPLVSIVC